MSSASPEVTYTYNAAGQKTSERFRGSSALPITYTIRGQVHDIGTPRNASYPHPFSARYTYTTGGNVSTAEFYQKQSPHAYKGYRYAFEYDGFNRMTAADFSRWSSGSSFIGSSYFDVSNITYDDAGNIITLRRRGGASTVLADNLTYIYSGANRLTGITDAAGANQGWDSGTISFQYDGNGNTTTYHDLTHNHYRTMTYDEFNRVSNYSNHNIQTSTRYRYNADGQRYLKRTNPFMQPSTVEYYAVDGNATIGVFSATGGGTWNIFTPSGEVVGRMTTSGSASYYIKDHLGSVRAVVNSSGTVLETRDYYPFGLEMPGRSYLSGTKAKENYTGYERDAETGMLYAGARYYMPNIGRWTSVDPLAASYPTWSPYNYVLNNPLGFVDPDGRCPVSGGWNHGGGSCVDRDDTNEDREVNWSRVGWGTAGVIGGLGEIIVGGGIASSTGVTGVGAAGGAALMIHGLSTIGFGVTNIVGGLSGDKGETPAGLAEAKGGVTGGETGEAVGSMIDAMIGLGSGLAAPGSISNLRNVPGMFFPASTREAAAYNSVVRLSTSGQITSILTDTYTVGTSAASVVENSTVLPRPIQAGPKLSPAQVQAIKQFLNQR